MGETSLGSVSMGLILTLLGTVGVVGGGFVVAETPFAEGGEERSEHGPLGLFGESESSEATVRMEPVLGLLVALGGIAATITGLVVVARSFERGKDRTADDT